MNTRQIFGIALLGLVANGVSADEYKCYVSAADGKNHIVLNEADNVNKANTLARSQKASIGLKKPVAVTSVIECKLATESFSIDKAKELDASTPR